MSSPKVLVVDDEKLIRWSLAEEFSKEGYEVFTAASGEEALNLVKAEDPDLVILDIRLPKMDGLTVLRHIKTDDPSRAIIMLTASDNLESAVTAMKLGAYDYLQKPFEAEKIKITVKNALETLSLRREVRDFRHLQAGRFGLNYLVGQSAAMQGVVEMTMKVARSETTTVLIEGESGTGKDLLARVLHFQSSRAQYPFMEIKCTSLPESLVESELFGHERGAFTDAKVMKKGLLELADGGTLLLDEIGEISPHLQSKLLGFIEEKRYKRVGGTKDITVDVRIVAATNRDLGASVREGRFREDLYFRLKVLPIYIPPLRERREDIPPLTKFFVDHFNREFKKQVRGITPEAHDLLSQYAWPGNIRELRNVIERALILESGEYLSPQDLPHEIAGRQGARPESTPFLLPEKGVVLDEVERSLVRQALERAGGNQVQASRLLGLSRHTLRYRMKKFGFP